LENSGSFKVDSHPRRHPWLRVGEWMLLALLAVHLGVRTLPRAWQTLNTDFPNYYLTARLVREHYDTSRVYEWIWVQRQKDHRDIDQRTVGMVPITPFSTLVVYPLTSLPALGAKRCWLILNLGLLFTTLYLLRALTQLPWRRLALVVALSFPLTTNFAFGQYYVLLLFLMTLSCWLYIRQWRFLTGVVVGLAAGLKIFPVLYLLYFLRKRDLRAFAGGAVGSLCTGIVSVVVFGWDLNRTYLRQVLPATLRGEALDPYNLQLESLGSLLHRLFVYEPQLNHHPAINAPWLFAVLHPLLQMALIAPALLLAVSSKTCPRRVRLEWAAIILASLAISTSPASYLFTLLILPVCLILESLQLDNSGLWVALLLPLYAEAGFLRGTSEGREGWIVLLGVPRLYALILLCVFAYALLIRPEQREAASLDRRAWGFALAMLLVFNIVSGLHHQRGLYADYQWRIPAPKQILMAVRPAIEEDAVPFVALLSDGYHLAVDRLGAVQFSSTSHDDYLAVTAANGERWVEQTGHESTIIPSLEERGHIRQAESPVASLDGRWLAFLRENRGRARIWIHDQEQPAQADKPLTPPALNVFEMSFLPKGELVFSAESAGRPSLFITDQEGSIRSLGMDDARYPSVSPDGHWLAYSELQGGNWNLWLRNLGDGETLRLTHAACNTIEPAWTADSQTVVYASDCGRGLWLTALCRRRIFR
jgi:Glycosyltransferase family 87/WD40-like Beta Propeller Repeat